jgi:hypothetical protein
VELHSMVADTRTLCELLHAELYTAELYKMQEEVMCTQGGAAAGEAVLHRGACVQQAVGYV